MVLCGILLGFVMFTCDFFLEFVPAFCGKPPVALRWLPRVAVSDRLVKISEKSVPLKIVGDKGEMLISDK